MSAYTRPSDVGPIAATFTPAQISVTGTATQLIVANPNRKSLSILNTGSATLYFGNANTVTSSNGAPLPPGDAYNFSDPVYNGALWAVSATGTIIVSVVELS